MALRYPPADKNREIGEALARNQGAGLGAPEEIKGRPQTGCAGGNQQPNDAGAKPFDTALPVWHGPRRDKKSIGKRT